MTSILLSDLRKHGFATRTSHLVARGHSRRSIARAVENGTVLRVSRGWIATADASQLGIAAIAQGGKLTAATALATQGIWDGVDRRVHVQVPANSCGPIRNLSTPIVAFTPPRFPPGTVVRHWAAERYPRAEEPPWRVSVIDALLRVATYAPSDQLIACIDSALHRRSLSVAGLPTLFSLLPSRLRPLQGQLDATADSGLESVSRVRLRPVVDRLETQVRIPGIARNGNDGRVDLLIDGWLVIELDGDEHHDLKADRDRNATLVRLGYRLHRFGYEQVINRWPEVKATILELLRYPPVRRH